MLRRGFTLIELLVTMAIIAILAGLLITAVSYAGKQGKGKKTSAILGALQNALQLFMTDKGGGAIRPAPHPALTLAGNQGVDTCADKRWPLFYGWPARAVSVLGSPQATVITAMTAQQRTWYAITDVNGDNVVDASDGSVPLKNRTFLNYVLAFGGADSALRDLKALDEKLQSDGSPEPGNIYDAGVYTPDGTGDGTGHGIWVASPGRLKTGAYADTTAKWKSYRLPGLAIYDAWGNEVIMAYDTSRKDGGVSLISAGADGLLARDPKNETAADRDNVLLGLAPQ